MSFAALIQLFPGAYILYGTTNVYSSPSSTGNMDKISPSDGCNNIVDNGFHSDHSDKGAKVVVGSDSVSSTSDDLGYRPASSSTVCFSSLDPILVPSNDSSFHGVVGAIRGNFNSYIDKQGNFARESIKVWGVYWSFCLFVFLNYENHSLIIVVPTSQLFFFSVGLS